jgi:hypothetical protein
MLLTRLLQPSTSLPPWHYIDDLQLIAINCSQTHKLKTVYSKLQCCELEVREIRTCFNLSVIMPAIGMKPARV